VGNGERNGTDTSIRRRSGNVSCAIFFIKNTNSSPWCLNLQVSCSGDVLIYVVVVVGGGGVITIVYFSNKTNEALKTE
jgi:hypothetical protein